MLFKIFDSQEERRKFGGTCFMELQYCRLEQTSEIKKIVSVDVIEDWKKDSLYVYGDDIDRFMSHYGKIFTGGIYNNGKSGMVDPYGINYYSRELTKSIIEKIKKDRPLDCQTLLDWLEHVEQYVGFYVLGL